jgi:hypothetical protein
MMEKQTPRFKEERFTNSQVLTRILTHPHCRVPDCLQNEVYGKIVKTTFDEAYKAARESLELWSLPETPVYGNELIRVISAVFVDDSKATLEEALVKREGLILGQNESLYERIDAMRVAFASLSGPDFGLRSIMVLNMLDQASNGVMPDNLLFQRAVFSIGYCKACDEARRVMGNLRAQIENIC